MPFIRCRLRKGTSDQIALDALRAIGLKEESVVEHETGMVHIYGSLPDKNVCHLDRPPLLFLLDEATPIDPNIDWEEQWAQSGSNFREGHVHLSLGERGELRLKPGPGFGDLSHATTRLVIDMMRGQIEGRHVVDFGSGSGILSLAAVLLGAESVLGIEIDRQALLHAQENAYLNELQDWVTFVEPSEVDLVLDPATVYLMNMTPADQEGLIDGLSLQPPLCGEWFVSGVLDEKREEYLRGASERGWQLVEEKGEGGWLGFHFQGQM